MGLVITPDILAKIKSKKIPKNSIQEINNYSNKNNNKKNNQKFIDIITNIYYPLYKKELKNFNENQKELLDNANNGNIINEINDIQKIKKK
jgi:hypothetical protein